MWKPQLTLFLGGDVMTGRGIDQILAHPASPNLYEPAVRDAREYVALAEAVNGAIPRGVPDAYIWGELLAELERARPDARIINLETSITADGSHWRDKEIHYRMHPANVGCLRAARIDVAALANNHVLDWGRHGLLDTLDALHAAGIQPAGAGVDLEHARRAARVQLAPDQQVLVFGMGSESSGIPSSWAASRTRSGVELIDELSERSARDLAWRLQRIKRRGDVAVASIHWGSNWGYEVSEEQVRFARLLIDGGFDVVHGHSSHHPRPMELYRNKLIVYGAGDLLNDYEGISGYASYRSELVLAWLVTLDAATGELEQLRLVPLKLRQCSLHRPSPEELEWMHALQQRLAAPSGLSFDRTPEGALALALPSSPGAHAP